MNTYRVTYLDGRSEQVDGDEVHVEGSGAIVIRREVLVMHRPRTIVARRFHAGDGVASVDLVPRV